MNCYGENIKKDFQLDKREDLDIIADHIIQTVDEVYQAKPQEHRLT